MRGAAGRGGLRRYRRGIAEERLGVAGGEMGRGGEPDRAGRGCYAGRGVALRQCAVDRKGACGARTRTAILCGGGVGGVGVAPPAPPACQRGKGGR